MQFGYAAAEEALRQSGLDLTEAPDRIGVTLGTAMAGITHICETQQEADQSGKLRISPRFVPKILGNIAAAQVAIHHGLHGPCFTLQTACSSGGDAINMAAVETGILSPHHPLYHAGPGLQPGRDSHPGPPCGHFLRHVQRLRLRRPELQRHRGKIRRIRRSLHGTETVSPPCQLL